MLHIRNISILDTASHNGGTEAIIAPISLLPEMIYNIGICIQDKPTYLHTFMVFKLFSMSLPPPLMFNNNNNNNHNASSHSPPGPFAHFLSCSNLKNMKRLNNRVNSRRTHTHKYTHAILWAFWWENSEGSASLPMWRSYILNQIHVCCSVRVSLSSSAHLWATASPQQLSDIHNIYPSHSSQALRCYCVCCSADWASHTVKKNK